MSSRIYHPEHPSDAPPIAWRSDRGTTNPARAQLAAPESSDLQQEMEARSAAAYQQGLAAGEAAAAQRVHARLDPVLSSMSTMLAELAGLRKTFRTQAEADTVALAIAIARRVIHRELTADPEAILGLVKAAFQKCDARETHKLRISPQDEEAVRGQRGQLNFPPGLEIVADGALVRGSAIFETSRGELDASVDSQLGEIERGLTDVLKRRTH